MYKKISIEREVSSLISKRDFRRESPGLNYLGSEKLDAFYVGSVEIFDAYYRSQVPDWKKIIKIEEKNLLPVLSCLTDPNLLIYEGASDVDRNDFISSIQIELQIRANKLDKEQEKRLRDLMIKRIPFIEKILGVTSEDRKQFKEGSSWISWIIGGVVIAAGAYATKKTIDHLTKEKDEKK